MSGSKYSTIGLTLACFDTICMDHLRETIESNNGFVSHRTKTFATLIQSKLEDYETFVKSDFCVMASLFDARVKQMVAPSTARTEAELADMIKKEWEDNFKDAFDASGSTGVERSVPKQGRFFARMRSKVSSQAQRAPEVDGDGNRMHESFEMELERYMRLDTSNSVGLDSCPLKFWRNRKDFPRMKFMARAFLAIPATSVPSEQAFSQAGEMISKKRNRLSDDSIEVMMVLHSWLKVLKML